MGKTYRRKENPIPVETYDFPNCPMEKTVPHGVYDIDRNEAGVTIGIDCDTAEFAVAAIQRCWQRLGSERYPKAKPVLITADSRGRNSPRTCLWRTELQRLANKTGLVVEVCHFPPGTSKWNKIEHKLFCHITRNWQWVHLETLEVVVNRIGNTRTANSLEVHAWIDTRNYEKARKVSEKELSEGIIHRNDCHGEWNYEIHPAR